MSKFAQCKFLAKMSPEDRDEALAELDKEFPDSMADPEPDADRSEDPKVQEDAKAEPEPVKDDDPDDASEDPEDTADDDPEDFKQNLRRLCKEITDIIEGIKE